MLMPIISPFSPHMFGPSWLRRDPPSPGLADAAPWRTPGCWRNAALVAPGAPAWFLRVALDGGKKSTDG